MIIADYVQPVVSKMRGRSELAPILPYYIAMAIIDLSENIEIEELKTTGPLANFVVGINEYLLSGYDINGIQGNPFINAADHKATYINSLFVYFDTSGVITPGVSMGKEMDNRDLRVVQSMSKIFGIPSVYCQFGGKQNRGKLIVGMMPDNPYAAQMRYQRQHPFNIKYGDVLQSINDTSLNNKLSKSEVYMPDDWSDVIVYAAAEKACDDNSMNEIGQLYHQKLYGYKDKRGNEMPGLIVAKQTQQDRQASFNSRALRPIVRRYT